MKKILTCGLLLAATTITCEVLAQTKSDIECRYKQREGLDNLFELVGLLDPLILNKKECTTERLKADRDRLDVLYGESQSSDEEFRSEFAKIRSDDMEPAFETSGQIQSERARIGAESKNGSKPKLPTVRGNQTISGKN